MIDSEDKENVLKATAKSPKQNITRSPGPKVAKLLDIFAHGSPRPHDPDSDPEGKEGVDVERPKYEFEKTPGQLKKMKAARAARLNESYLEASMVISKLLDSDNEEGAHSESEPANQKPALKPTFKAESKNCDRVLFRKEAAATQESNEHQEGFDVQKFLRNLSSRNASEQTVEEARSGSKFRSETDRESPRPTAALAYFHLVSGERGETPSKRAKLGASDRMQNLLSSFENLDDPIRPPSKTLYRDTTPMDQYQQNGEEAPDEKRESVKAKTEVADRRNRDLESDNTPLKNSAEDKQGSKEILKPMGGRSTPKKPQVSSYVSNMITQLKNSSTKKRESDDEIEDPVAVDTGDVEKSLNNQLEVKESSVDRQPATKISSEDNPSVSSEQLQKENREQSRQQGRIDLGSVAIVRGKRYLKRDNECEEMTVNPSMSEFQKSLLMKAKSLKRQTVPSPQKDSTLGRVLDYGQIEEDEPDWRVVGDERREGDDEMEVDVVGGGEQSSRRNVVEFNSVLDIKSATSDSFSNSNFNYSTEDAAALSLSHTTKLLEETNDSIYSKINFSARSEEEDCSDAETAVNKWVSNPYAGPTASKYDYDVHARRRGSRKRQSNSEDEDSSEYASTSSEFLSLPRMSRDVKYCDVKRPAATATATPMTLRTAESSLTYSTIGSLSSTAANSGDSTLSSSRDVSDVDCTLLSSSSLASSEQVAATASVLMDEIEVQQHIIQQVSRALNIAETRNRSNNSQEQIEAERVLLLSHARQHALKQELATLRHLTLNKPRHAKPEESSNESVSKPLPCFGNVTLSNISLPLRRDEMFHMDLTRRCLHYVCLVRYKTQVVATQLVPALSDFKVLNFANMITFRNVEPNFQLVLEIWSYACLKTSDTASSSKLPKKLKMQNAAEKRKAPFLMSPFVKKSKHSTSSVDSQPSGKGHQGSKEFTTLAFSPAMTPGYRQLGFKKVASLLLTKSNSAKRAHCLDQINYDDAINPLSGTLSLCCDLFPFFQMEFKGFLNMEDQNKGIWHMRWCVLTNTKLSYWKFAENETKRAAIGSVDLQQCERVAEVSRAVCAIPHAFALHMNTPSALNYRLLLSTDSKESRADWMRNLELVLVNLQTWTCN